MYLRYPDMVNKNKYIFDKKKNTFQIRVFMYLRYLDMLNKNSFSKIKNTSEQIYNRINIFYHVFGHVKKDSSLK